MKSFAKKLFSVFLSFFLLLSINSFFPVSAYAASAPTFIVKAPSDISTADARINATVKNPSGLKIEKVGFVISINGKNYDCYDVLNNTWKEIGASFSVSTYLNKFHNGVRLAAGTNYQYYFYVKLSNKSTYSSSTSSFTTKADTVAPSISLRDVTNLSYTDAHINARINNPSRIKINKVGFYITNMTTGTIKVGSYNANYNLATADEYFSMSKYGITLEPATQYYYVFYIETDAYGRASKSGYFTTPALQNNTPSSLTTNEKILSFISDSRWMNGAHWHGRTPIISNYSSAGCTAYVADFCKYVYGYDFVNNDHFDKIYEITALKEGDIVYFRWDINNEYNKGGDHWIAIIGREGNDLEVAEGGMKGPVNISHNYWIKDGKLWMGDDKAEPNSIIIYRNR